MRPEFSLSFPILTYPEFPFFGKEENPFRPPEDQPGRARPRVSNQQWPRESPPLRNAGPHLGTTRNHKTGGTTTHQPTEQPGHAGQAAPGPRTIQRPETQNSASLLHPPHGRPPRPYPKSPKVL
ncbi:hypothetical protein TNCV_2164251 [Trichonephila clavipes]|nr:hypothetical protein TNCV_2164251 [Trichonephila clavipes]